MEIKFKTKHCVYAICIGYKTPWFAQTYFISITQEWFDNMKVSYAKLLFHT